MTDTMEVTDADIDAVLSGADPDAPYGRFKNGKPRKRAAGAGPTIPSVPAPRKNVPRSAPSAARKGMPDYAQLSKNVLQIPVIALSVSGAALQATGREQLGTGLALDGMTISLYQEQLADVGKRMAESDSGIARWLEKFGKGGAIGEGISLVLVMGCQFMVNHGRMAPMPAAGLLTPQQVFDKAQELNGITPTQTGPADGIPGS